MLTDADLCAARIETLFVSDARGRLLGYREPWAASTDLGPAPRCFVFNSAQGLTCRLRSDQPDALAAAIQSLCESAAAPFQPAAPSAALDQIVNRLAPHSPIANVSRGPAFRIDDTDPQLATSATRITAANAALLTGAFAWLHKHPAAYLDFPAAGVIADGQFVSICFCARQTLTTAEAGLDTLPAYRGRGYGVAAAACWAGLVQAEGRTALYSTEWDNDASLAVARKLNARLYGEDISIN
jgi:hypothetical protein